MLFTILCAAKNVVKRNYLILMQVEINGKNSTHVNLHTTINFCTMVQIILQKYINYILLCKIL